MGSEGGFCIAKRRWLRNVAAGVRRWSLALGLGAGLGFGLVAGAAAQGPSPSASGPAVAASAPRAAAGIAVPRLAGRLQAGDIGLVINTADPYSVAVGEYYIRRRGLTPAQVLRVQLPMVPTLTLEQFETLRHRIDLRFGRQIQALALAWVGPYAVVGCNSISGALAQGYDASFCDRGCLPTRPSRYFNTATFKPYSELGFRPSMLLAAPSIEQAKALIDRGVASDHSLARRGRPPVTAMLLLTGDVPRSVRVPLYPPAGPVPGVGVNIRVEPASRLSAGQRVFMVSTGTVTLDLSTPPDWVPGALADHLTSYGGDLLGGTGQSNAMEWIASGATASHGTVTEPCNYPQKFPHPQVLLLHYLQGATALEAYWKSVAWPQQALFVGEPLAAPFAAPFAAPAAAPSSPALAAPAAAAPATSAPAGSVAPGDDVTGSSAAAAAASAAAGSASAPVPGPGP
jgi:uncharacterized protein (TIGR03790 family)